MCCDSVRLPGLGRAALARTRCRTASRALSALTRSHAHSFAYSRQAIAGTAVGPLLLGIGHDHYHAFAPVLRRLAVLPATIGFAAQAFLRRPVHPREAAAAAAAAAAATSAGHMHGYFDVICGPFLACCTSQPMPPYSRRVMCSTSPMFIGCDWCLRSDVIPDHPRLQARRHQRPTGWTGPCDGSAACPCRHRAGMTSYTYIALPTVATSTWYSAK